MTNNALASQPPTPPEIKLPPAVAAALQTHTRLFLDALFTVNPVTRLPVKRRGAASIIAVMERSGAIAAAGIVAYFERHQIADPRLLRLSHMGHELEDFCGYILYPELPQYTDQEFLEDFRRELTALVAANTHPVTAQVDLLAAAIAQLPDGDHELQVIDDYMAEGGVNEVIMPIIVELAAQRAGLPPTQVQVKHATVEELIQQHLIDEEPHHNRFAHAAGDAPQPSTAGKTIRFDPAHSIAMVPELSHWLHQIVEASFGPHLTICQAGYLDEALRGATDFDLTPYTTPASMAFSRGVTARGFDSRTDKPPFRTDPQREIAALLTAHGIPEAEIDGYVAGLHDRLCREIVAVTGSRA